MGQQRALTIQQSKFIGEYIKNGENATQAAITAGYAEKTAAEQGSALLTRPQVKAELDRRKEDIAAASLVTTHRVVTELGKIAFLDSKLFFDENGSLKKFADLPESVTCSIGGFDVDKEGKIRKVRVADKIRALELISKIAGLVKPDTQNVQVVILPPKESAPTIDAAPALPKPEWE